MFLQTLDTSFITKGPYRKGDSSFPKCTTTFELAIWNIFVSVGNREFIPPASDDRCTGVEVTITGAALATELQFTTRCKGFATINEPATSNIIFVNIISTNRQKRVTELFTGYLMLKDHTLTDIQEVSYPLRRPCLTNLKCAVTEPLNIKTTSEHLNSLKRSVCDLARDSKTS